ncbi:hypothetical protein INR49_019438 [Caranx melampygus]|nr:hypothetical protein INR49_019438 [Caranx melampygus]
MAAALMHMNKESADRGAQQRRDERQSTNRSQIILEDERSRVTTERGRGLPPPSVYHVPRIKARSRAGGAQRHCGAERSGERSGAASGAERADRDWTLTGGYREAEEPPLFSGYLLPIMAVTEAGSFIKERKMGLNDFIQKLVSTHTSANSECQHRGCPLM